jgi:MFS family permease
MSGVAVFFFADHISNSLSVAGLTVGAYSLVSSITAAPRGHAIDRWGQTRPLLLLVPTFTLATLAMAFLAKDRESLILWAAVMGLTAPPINMSLRPLWRTIVDDEQLRTAWALDSAILNGTGLVGPVLGTWLTLDFSGQLSLSVMAALMGIGGAILMSSSISRNWQPEQKVEGEHGLLRSPAMRILAFEAVLIGLGYGIFDVAIPSDAKLAGMSSWAAPTLAAVALGGLLGGIAAGAWFKRVEPGRGLVNAQTLFALMALPLALIPTGLPMVVAVFLGGIPLGMAQVFYLEVVEIVRPRGAAVAAMGSMWFIEGSAAAGGNAAAGFISENWGSEVALSLVGIFFLASSLTLLWAVKTVMRPALTEAAASRAQSA